MKGQILKTSTMDSWSSKDGTFYPHWITLTDGKTIRLNKKKPDAFQPGDEVWYEIKEEKRTKNDALYYDVKQIKPPDGDYPQKSHGSQQVAGKRFGGGTGSNASLALSYAKDVAVAEIAASGKPMDMLAIGDKIIALAEKFELWLDRPLQKELDFDKTNNRRDDPPDPPQNPAEWSGGDNGDIPFAILFAFVGLAWTVSMFAQGITL